MPQVELTHHLRRFFADLAPCEEVSGASVAEALAALDARHPGLAAYVADERGALRPHVNIFVDGSLVRDRERLSDPLTPDARVFIVQALSGG